MRVESRPLAVCAALWGLQNRESARPGAPAVVTGEKIKPPGKKTKRRTSQGATSLCAGWGFWKERRAWSLGTRMWIPALAFQLWDLSLGSLCVKWRPWHPPC